MRNASPYSGDDLVKATVSTDPSLERNPAETTTRIFLKRGITSSMSDADIEEQGHRRCVPMGELSHE
jgi:hypothetical protein